MDAVRDATQIEAAIAECFAFVKQTPPLVVAMDRYRCRRRLPQPRNTSGQATEWFDRELDSCDFLLGNSHRSSVDDTGGGSHVKTVGIGGQSFEPESAIEVGSSFQHPRAIVVEPEPYRTFDSSAVSQQQPSFDRCAAAKFDNETVDACG